MVEQNILILHPSPKDLELLRTLCRPVGNIHTASTIAQAIQVLEKTDVHVVVVDWTLGAYPSLKGLFKTTTSILITGPEEHVLEEAARSWPMTYYVDFHPLPTQEHDNQGFLRAVVTAAEHAFLKAEVINLKGANEQNGIRLREAYSEIKKIKHFINQSIVKEIERRVSVEAKYLGVKKEKQKIEETLKKLYMANDVTSLLDVVYDIKEIVGAEGISIYLLEESETHGKYLKPLVWDDAFLTHPESAKHFVLIDSEDFAAFAARHGQEVNSSDVINDTRLSRRYVEELSRPLSSILCVPILKEKEAIGVLEVVNKARKPGEPERGFTPDDEKVMRRFSEHISIAMTKLNLIQYDALTGLLRPEPFFEKVIQKLLLERKRHKEGSSFALVMGDVDWFKNYNDRNGHEAGNRLLRELAAVLRTSTRDEDLLCRYGGEEFLIFLSGINSEEEAVGFTERIRKNIEEHPFANQEIQPRGNLTMSFGLTFFSRDRIRAWDTISKANLKKLANEADMALAEAKGKKMAALGLQDQPKNRVCLYDKDKVREAERPSPLHAYMRKHERRRHKRFHTSTIMLYRRNDFHRVTKTVNLSLGGAKIPTEACLNSDQILDLILILGNNACQLKGEVVYSTEAGAGTSYYFTGLKFRDVSVKDRKILEDYFSSLEPKGKTPS